MDKIVEDYKNLKNNCDFLILELSNTPGQLTKEDQKTLDWLYERRSKYSLLCFNAVVPR